MGKKLLGKLEKDGGNNAAAAAAQSEGHPTGEVVGARGRRAKSRLDWSLSIEPSAECVCV